MQNLINEAPAKKNYDFIDAIRCLSMIAIVAEHSMGAGGYTFAYGTPKYWAYITLLQVAKFGTISCFFVGRVFNKRKIYRLYAGTVFKTTHFNHLWAMVILDVCLCNSHDNYPAYKGTNLSQR